MAFIFVYVFRLSKCGFSFLLTKRNLRKQKSEGWKTEMLKTFQDFLYQKVQVNHISDPADQFSKRSQKLSKWSEMTTSKIKRYTMKFSALRALSKQQKKNSKYKSPISTYYPKLGTFIKNSNANRGFKPPIKLTLDSFTRFCPFTGIRRKKNSFFYHLSDNFINKNEIH